MPVAGVHVHASDRIKLRHACAVTTVTDDDGRVAADGGAGAVTTPGAEATGAGGATVGSAAGAALGSAAALVAGCEGLGSGGAGSAAGAGVLPGVASADDVARSGGVLDANQYHPAATRTRAASPSMIARHGPRLATGTGTAECVIGNVAAGSGAITACDRRGMSPRGTERAALAGVEVRGGVTDLGGAAGLVGVAGLVGTEVGEIAVSDRNGMSAIDGGCAALAGVAVRGAVAGFGGAAARGGTTVCATAPGLGEVAPLGGAAVFGGAVVDGAAALGGGGGGRIGASGDDRGDTGGLLNGRPRAWQNCSRFSRLVTKNGSVGASFETAMANARR